MRDDDFGSVEVIAAAIAAYLRRHTLAADSVEGVAQWWLGPAYESATTTQVERALELLVARQIVRRVRLTDGSFLYSLVPPIRQ